MQAADESNTITLLRVTEVGESEKKTQIWLADAQSTGREEKTKANEGRKESALQSIKMSCMFERTMCT